MDLKDLLVVVDNDPACASRVDVAVTLARAHGAHLTGLHVVPWPPPMPYTRVPLAPELDTMVLRELEEEAQRAEATFWARAGRGEAQVEWRKVEGQLLTTATGHARYADLTIVGQGLDLVPAGTLAVLPETLALGVGRPVLVVPRYGSFPTVGRRVLVAWNGSREATRAVNDAIPILRRAEEVTVLAIDSDMKGVVRIPGADIALHLARHGVKVQADTIAGADISVGDLLLNYAADHGIDLTVMGAYGHSRLREMVLGGATRHLLQHMTAPVLLSH
jgi:nucleotide-binding universal stress UspA family protein